MKFWAIAGLLLISGACAQSPSSPFVPTTPTPESRPGLAPLPPASTAPISTAPVNTAPASTAPVPIPSRPLTPTTNPSRFTAPAALPAPRISSGGGTTRVVLDLPAGARYTLTPTFSGLRVDVGNVGVRAQNARNVTTELSEWAYIPVLGGTIVTLITPYPLGLYDGWRSSELPSEGSLPRRLVLDFGARIRGGATGATSDKVLIIAPSGLPATAAAPPPNTASVPPVSVPPVTAPPVTVPPVAPVQPTVPVVPVTPPVGGFALLSPPRLGLNPGSTRVVLDLPPTATFAMTPLGNTLRVDVQGVSARGGAGAGISPELGEWRLDPAPGGATVSLRATFPLSARGGWRSVLLPPVDGSVLNRLAIDFSPAFADITPLPPTEAALPPFPLPVRIVLDPGHGGVDPGAVGTVMEKVTTLDVARRVRSLLAQAGAQVVMTRDADTQLSMDKVTDLRMRAAMGAAPAKVLVSIHVNAIVPQNVLRGYGVETWWYPNDAGSSGLAASVQSSVIRFTSAASHGQKTESLAVLRGSRVPSALVEIGYTSHPIDGQNLLSTNYLDRVAAGIAWGIRNYIAQGAAQK